ncbi:uncharacterized protein LOC131156186 isoform X1 [Malania oleifera]|uniref:uncharacterized protein LOC131156186 isoform X1 n=1 Tax=Malania oleifera TaxID=397392 RepID=UPI0025ADAFFE|nr:uncharacterized protein LOC131156186 isoform X1 [Malania oleifera]
MEDGCSSVSVGEFIRKEVRDWDDEATATARFKAFSGQRSDWESRFLFWRDLIIKVARHLRIFIISPSQVKSSWFNRGGLTPLCLDDVLFLMYNEGDIVRSKDVVDPTSGRLSQLYRKVIHLLARSTPSEIMLEDYVILLPVLKDKADEIVKILSESHWTSSCIITMKKFQEICGGYNEATAVLSFLSGCQKAQYLTIKKMELIEGVKISLSPAAVCSITSLDSDVLQLIWTTEKLQQQLEVIDRRCDKSKKLASAFMNSGNKNVALRHARELKLAYGNREKCMSFLNRVEEVLNVISNAESTKKVSEAIQIGARAMKENKISVEEIQLCLQELDESIDSQKQIEKALGSSPSSVDVEDEDIEDELDLLELEVKNFLVPTPKAKSEASEAAESLSDALINLKLADAASKETMTLHGGTDSTASSRNNALKNLKLEAA